MQSAHIVLAGFGHVGRAFFRLIAEKRPLLLDRYDLDLSVRAVIRSGGGRVSSGGLDADLSSVNWDPGVKLESTLRNMSPGILVEALPSSLKTGEPALSVVRKALGQGWHVVGASKGPLVTDFQGLTSLARGNRVEFRYGAATGAALPTIDVGRRSLAGAEILKIDGILNGTSNFILTRMGEGADYAAALAEAQAKGIAEPDPSLDVGGWDSAAKLVIIANTILEASFSLEDVQVGGIADFIKFAIGRARAEGKKMKLLARFIRRGEAGSLKVAPEVIEPSHPLYGVDGTNKGVAFFTDSMGTLVLTGGKSDPRGAAAALLRDLIGIYVP
jgi:homoserine dehydrogenase